jgi:methionyl-tRNA formyltransferase
MKSVLIAGQKHFGKAVAELVQALCSYDVAAVCCPVGPRPDALHEFAKKQSLPVIPSGAMTADSVLEACPDGIDLIILAHCHDFIRIDVREFPRIGCLGYHPSLLPLWRGKTAIECQIASGERVTGGTVYWLDSSFDGGPVAAQRHAIIPHGSTPASLWREVLQPLGIHLLADVLISIDQGFHPSAPQDSALATFCPVAA